MSNREAIRLDVAGIVTQMITDHTIYPLVVEMDNRTLVDQAAQTNPYLKVQIKWLNGQQMDMANKPLVGQFGQILLVACVKKDAGTIDANKLLDFCYPYFELKDFTTMRTKVFEPTGDQTVSDWYYVTGLINMFFHRVSA